MTGDVPRGSKLQSEKVFLLLHDPLGSKCLIFEASTFFGINYEKENT